MRLPARTRTVVWIGRVVALVVIGGLAFYLVEVGLEDASKIATVLAFFVAVIALFGTYLLPLPQAMQHIVQGSGPATATKGGHAVTGIGGAGSGQAHVSDSGPARADGAGSVAITGVDDTWRPG